MLNQDLIKGAPAAAKFCGLPLRTIYHLVEIGELPAIKKGKALYFRRSELESAFRSTASA
ncbi:MAG: helix-turn-helix domain-containing protein [Sphingopyxis granuli]|uniref:helix-turn-helix domain-containing protein n=1 Tax=Sphingopyxis granuli TaxID=267128 RepID=UPI003C708255